MTKEYLSGERAMFHFILLNNSQGLYLLVMFSLWMDTPSPLHTRQVASWEPRAQEMPSQHMDTLGERPWATSLQTSPYTVYDNEESAFRYLTLSV